HHVRRDSIIADHALDRGQVPAAAWRDADVEGAAAVAPVFPHEPENFEIRLAVLPLQISRTEYFELRTLKLGADWVKRVRLNRLGACGLKFAVVLVATGQ